MPIFVADARRDARRTRGLGNPSRACRRSAHNVGLWYTPGPKDILQYTCVPCACGRSCEFIINVLFLLLFLEQIGGKCRSLRCLCRRPYVFIAISMVAFLPLSTVEPDAVEL